MEDPLLFMAGAQGGAPPSSQPSSLPCSLNKDDADITLLFEKKKINDHFGPLRPNPQFGHAVKKTELHPKRKMGESRVYLSLGLRITGTQFCMNSSCLPGICF